MMKKLLFLSAVLSLCFVSCGDKNEPSAPDGETPPAPTNLTWTFDEVSGTLTIEGEGEMGIKSWRIHSHKVKKIVLPSGLTSICDDAFNNFSEITSVDIPANVQSIGANAFYSCDKLQSVTLRYGLKSIGAQAFAYTPALLQIILPNSVITLGKQVFMKSGLRGIGLQEPLKYVPEGFVQECENLQSISLPDGMTSIGKNAFWKCTSLTSVTIPSTVMTIAYAAFRQTAIQGITLPDELTSIGNYAFEYCANLKAIEIPSNVMTIGTCAFSSCTSLGIVTCEREIPPSIELNTFSNIPEDATLKVPKNSINSYKSSTCNWSRFFKPANIIAM